MSSYGHVFFIPQNVNVILLNEWMSEIVDAYVKFTDLEGAGRLFDEMPEGTTMPLCQAGAKMGLP